MFIKLDHDPWIFDIVILDPATGAQKLLDIDDEKR